MLGVAGSKCQRVDAREEGINVGKASDWIIKNGGRYSVLETQRRVTHNLQPRLYLQKQSQLTLNTLRGMQMDTQYVDEMIMQCSV